MTLYAASVGFRDRLRFQPGNFFDDPLPSAEVITMEHILHDWKLDEKRPPLCRFTKRNNGQIKLRRRRDSATVSSLFGMFVQEGEHVRFPSGHATIGEVVPILGGLTDRRIDLKAVRLPKSSQLCDECFANKRVNV